MSGGIPAEAALHREPIIRKTIPKTGETIPAIGLGTWQVFDVEGGKAMAARETILREFVTLGGSLVDSSPMYGRAEQVVGELIARHDLRSRIFLATKVWTTGKRRGADQIERSFHLFKSQVIDLLQVHNLIDLDTHQETLARLKSEGRVKYVGVTHCISSQHEAIARAITSFPLDFIQINYSLDEPEAARRLLPLALDHGVAVIANRPLTEGDLATRLRRRPLPSWAGEIGCGSWPELALKYVISHPAVTAAIPATRRLEHLRDNMAAGRGILPDGAMRVRIERAAEG